MVSIVDNKISPKKKIKDNLEIQVIYIPLESNLGIVYNPCVSSGDYVKIGQVVGNNKTAQFPLLSTVSGVVVGFQDKYISNGKMVSCIVIENDFKEKYQDKVGKKYDITKYSRDEFLYLLENSSIVGMGGAGFPTYIKYNTKNKIKYLIINGTECEIGPSSDSYIMYNYPEEILEAIDAIMEIMDIDQAYIAIKESNTMVIKKILKYINTYPKIKIYPLIDAYPCGYERFLVANILGLKYEKLPLEVNTIINNVSTIYAIYEMLKYHRPLIDRVITITGNGIKNPANYKVKIGTNFSEIVLKEDLYKKMDDPVLIAGGMMMGKSICSDDLIITGDLGCIVIMENNKEEYQACIKCGKCSEVCPMGLIPSMIIKDRDMASELQVNKCIGCGLCSYVCPSKIEIRDIIKNIKENKND